ncbi:MAG: response regulator transcription factor, partial [Deltaproteobacteria bacterium]|nr:response regulator transcription factor [Deltaproteobacteria bacterium]
SEVALVDIHLGDNKTDGLDFIRKIRQECSDTIPVVLSGDRTQEQFFNAARVGAIDFFVKGPHVNIMREMQHLLEGKRGAVVNRTRPEIVSDLGYLRTFGLTRREIAVLTDFARDFPKLSDLADRLPQAKTQLRKVFSRIYTKLGIKNLNQLISILTVCEFFDRDN